MIETKTYIWQVRGIDGVRYASKLDAEIAAREEFASEPPDRRYGRVYYAELVGSHSHLKEMAHRLTKCVERTPMPRMVYTVTGFDEGTQDDIGTYTFETKNAANEFMLAAKAITGRDVTWRTDMVIIEDAADAVEALRRDWSERTEVEAEDE